MPAPLKRATAGARVARLVEGLSASLVADENEAKASMEALFTGGLPALAESVSMAHGPAGRLHLDEVVEDVVRMANNMLAASAGPFATLLGSAVGKGLESIREELQICEQSLAKRYAGISGRACDLVDDASGQLVDVGLAQYAGNAGSIMVWFTQQLRLELNVSQQAKEPLELMLSRVMAPERIAAAQHSGRGLWWKVLEHCNRLVREIEFSVVNAARTEAMMRFNELGDAVDADSV